MSVLYDEWCSDGPINSQEYKSFGIYAVTIKISMTEYQANDWMVRPIYNLFSRQHMGRNE